MALRTFDCIIVALLLSAVLWVRRRRSHPKMPPGPPGRFLIGNMLDIPTENEGQVYAKWGEQYGSDIVSASVFGTNIVVINSHEKCIELLEKKSAIYSGRPRIPMSGELMGCKVSMGMMPYGPTLRQGRKMMHQELNSRNAIRTFFPHEETMARSFLARVLERPKDFIDHTQLHADRIIMKIGFGHMPSEMDDKFIQSALRSMEEMGKGCEPTFLVNAMPILMHYPEWMPWPGTHFKKVAKLWRAHYDEMVDEPFNMVKEQMKKGEYDESFVSKWLAQAITPEDEETLKHAAGAMFGAGGETTAIALNVFFCMMALHPEIQRECQKELDNVIGRDRLPTFEDRENLPYINALCKEILRTHPPVPLSLPHCTTEDDMHDGYFIPKDSIIFINMWKLTKDPAVHANPEKFDPTRFLGPNPERDPGESIFGFGRRVCPGLNLADASLFITTAMTLSVFNISPVVRDGKPVTPVFKPIPGPISRIAPFECSITPREDRAKAAALIASL